MKGKERKGKERKGERAYRLSNTLHYLTENNTNKQTNKQNKTKQNKKSKQLLSLSISFQKEVKFSF